MQEFVLVTDQDIDPTDWMQNNDDMAILLEFAESLQEIPQLCIGPRNKGPLEEGSIVEQDLFNNPTSAMIVSKWFNCTGNL